MTYLRVKELGEQQGLNITTLSRKAELAYSSAHSIWHGDVTQINIKTLDRIARALGVQVSDLFGDTEEDEDDTRAYDAAKAHQAEDEMVPIEQAMAEFEERTTARKAS